MPIRESCLYPIIHHTKLLDDEFETLDETLDETLYQNYVI